MAYDVNKIHLLLSALDKIFVKDGSFSYEKAATLILQICNFMETNGRGLEETHKITEEKAQEISESKNKIIELKKSIAEIEQKRIQALRKSRIRLAELRAFTVCKKAFLNAGIDFINLKKITNVLSTIHQLDSNPALIINEMEKTSALVSRKLALTKDCDERIKNLQIYQEQEKLRAMYNDSYHVAVDLMNKILVKGVPADEMISMMDAIIDNKFYMSIPDFISDINTYGGTKSAIFKRKRELEKLRSEQKDLIDSRNSDFV